MVGGVPPGSLFCLIGHVSTSASSILHTTHTYSCTVFITVRARFPVIFSILRCPLASLRLFFFHLYFRVEILMTVALNLLISLRKTEVLVIVEVLIQEWTFISIYLGLLCLQVFAFEP
jgi:hypothetical protein